MPSGCLARAAAIALLLRGGLDGPAPGARCRRRLSRRCSLDRCTPEEARGLPLVKEPPGRQLVRGLLVQGRRPQGAANPLLERPRGRGAGFARDRGGVARELVDHLTLLRGRPLKSDAIAAREQCLLRLAQPLAGREQPLDVARSPPRELVQRPGGDGRLAERLDGLGVVSPAFAPQTPGELVPGLREVRQRQPIEIVLLRAFHRPPL